MIHKVLNGTALVGSSFTFRAACSVHGLWTTIQARQLQPCHGFCNFVILLSVFHIITSCQVWILLLNVQSTEEDYISQRTTGVTISHGTRTLYNLVPRLECPPSSLELLGEWEAFQPCRLEFTVGLSVFGDSLSLFRSILLALIILYCVILYFDIIFSKISFSSLDCRCFIPLPFSPSFPGPGGGAWGGFPYHGHR